MNKRNWIFGLGALLAVLVVPALWLNHDRYTALATGVQAFGVVIALLVASETLAADRRDRKTDRTLALHAELVSGPLNDRRVRLVDHLRTHGQGNQVASASRNQLKSDAGPLGKYSDSQGSPLHDANALLRFFERANAAHAANIVDASLFHQLIAGQALWWHLALSEGEQLPIRLPLGQLAAWTDQYTTLHPKDTAYTTAWERSFARDFGDRRKIVDRD
jgi:hypothetical protein